MAKKPRTESKSYRERLDPGGEFEKQVKGLALLASGPFGWVLKKLGVDEVTLEEAKGMPASYVEMLAAPERIARTLVPLGWVFFEDSPLEKYKRAAALAEDGKIQEAEEILVAAWNEGKRMMLPSHRVTTLYFGEEEREDIGLERSRLLRKAYEHHEAERYEASILLALAQIDGIFVDMTGKPAKYFFDAKNPHLADEETLAGHPLGLQALAEFLSKVVTKTQATGELTRHGIFHGRELAYDTRRNSTKALVSCLAVIEKVRPAAKRLSEEAAAKRERRYAGSKDIDADGRRLDRRGFTEAKELLREIAAYEYGHYKREGRYAANEESLDPSGLLLENRRADEIVVSRSGEEYYAWKRARAGYVFGVACRAGAGAGWEYAGEKPPEAGPDSEAEWRHVANHHSPPGLVAVKLL